MDLSGGQDGEQRKMESRCLDDVEQRSLPSEIAEDTKREPQLSADAPPSLDIEAHTWRDCDHVDPGDVRVGSRLPLLQRQVGDFVAAGGDAFGKRPVPPLAAPDGVGVEAVVDEADPHARGLRPPRGRALAFTPDAEDVAAERAMHLMSARGAGL